MRGAYGEDAPVGVRWPRRNAALLEHGSDVAGRGSGCGALDGIVRSGSGIAAVRIGRRVRAVGVAVVAVQAPEEARQGQQHPLG